jgi:hypothetical protein
MDFTSTLTLDYQLFQRMAFELFFQDGVDVLCFISWGNNGSTLWTWKSPGSVSFGQVDFV